MMNLKKNYIKVFLLAGIICLAGCRHLAEFNEDHDLLVEPDYLNAFVITSPQRASFWKPGAVIEIKWITVGSVERVDIQLYRKTSLQRTLINNLDNSGTFNWRIPNEINHSLHYKIKISNHNNPDEHELSERFAILD